MARTLPADAVAAATRSTLGPAVWSVATALPEHRVAQSDAKDLVAALFASAIGPDRRRLLQVFENTGIESRRVCMPLPWYGEPHGFGETNALYVEHALALCERAAREALARAGLVPEDVDHIVLVSSTGIATPSLDARLANRLALREDVRRTPIWGLGCAGGVAGMSRARDFALADPRARVLLLAVELCSLTFQREDRDRRNLVATSLFSDGAAAAVVGGAQAVAGPRAVEAPLPATRRSPLARAAGGGAATPIPARHAALELLGARSTLWRDTLDVMGWTVDQGGLHVVFSRDIPSIVRRWVRPSITGFLGEHDLEIGDITHLIAHPGGPKVLAAYVESLGVPPDAFRHSRAVLRSCGNMSSPTCLFVLERAIEAADFVPGDLGLMAALGPGFASEVVLFRAR